MTGKSPSRESGSRSFRGSVASVSIVKRLLLGFILLLVEIILDVRRGRDEGAHVGILRDAVRAILPLSGKDRVQIGFCVFTHAGEGVQIELRVPGAGDAEGGVSSSAGSGALPLTDPPASTLEAIADEGEGVRHLLARP